MNANLSVVCKALAVASLLTLAACGGSSSSASPSAVPTPSPAPSPTPAPAPAPAFSTVDLREGTGATAFAGRNVIVTYTGWLYDPTKTDSKGTQFDSGTFLNTASAAADSLKAEKPRFALQGRFEQTGNWLPVETTIKYGKSADALLG